MTTPALLIILGGSIGVSGLFGGGFETKWFKVPSLSKIIRVFSGIAGVILVIFGSSIYLKEQQSIQTPPPPPPPNLIDIKGKVVDQFDNPMNEIWVTTGDRFAITDEQGQYHFSSIPFKNNITVEAHYSRIDGNKYTSEISWPLKSENKGKTEILTEKLVIEPITIDAFLCRDVDISNYQFSGKFEGDLPINLDSLSANAENKRIWCFLVISGPLNYHNHKDTRIVFEWYYNDELQDQNDPYSPVVGVSPSGWRHPASKNVAIGKWVLKIKTKNHKELVNIPFEIYDQTPGENESDDLMPI